MKPQFQINPAGVVKLVDTLDLGSSASRHGGSSPSTRTVKIENGRMKNRRFLKKASYLFNGFRVFNSIVIRTDNEYYKRKFG